jgi:hypothetical protein
MTAITDYFAANSDPYAPLVPIDSLQQYDNYQIHDLYCIDVIYGSINTITSPPSLFRSFLAVEVYRFKQDYIPYTDFNLIAQTYP